MKKFFEQKKSALISGMNSNKGFSLVELIIVVAIMAVLMGVLAPQYLRFVESSREQTDVSAANEIVKVLRIAVATMTEMPTEALVWDTGSGGVSAGTATDLQDEIDLTLGTGGSSVGKAASTLYGSTGAGSTSGKISFYVQQDSSGVPFVWTDSAWISYNLGIPNSTSQTDIATEPTR